MRNSTDIIGRRFQMLVVLHQVENAKDGKRQYECLCDCGKTRVVKGTDLRQGRVRSCGCFNWRHHKDFDMKIPSDHRLYHIWFDMKRRCYQPQNKGYGTYGAKGIIVCDEWLHDFYAFNDWAKANGYAEHLS